MLRTPLILTVTHRTPAMERSSDYQATVGAIEAAGFLRPPQRVELLDVQGTRLDGVGRGAVCAPRRGHQRL